MRSATLIPIEEYLRSSYSPDREYLDGAIVERNLGEKTHGRIQRRLITYLDSKARQLGIEVIPEQRAQVTARRFRVPDVTVVTLPQPEEEIITTPPHLCIEILSKDDTMNDMQERIDDYLSFGVPFVWIVNPWKRKGYVVTRAKMVEARLGILETQNPDIAVPLSALFAE